ncbi:hypothetical protein [Legionella maioricensis]|uniref:Coiled-coil protein n=1 Tax=Legionella maioricensis TaxID=2896528 RepID=A0A9X2CYD9_9GAMM|nr:hypothetical protein [Legionella maioricensis]MCL9682979.1 hypothetical protein [Legionella maioricensis]MCL9686327.1 hypothetical protein [Legionella maioricensis]
MTIFLMVLKQLIKEQLNKAEATLGYQATLPLIYEQLLSLQKKSILDELEKKIIVEFKATGDDETDSKAIGRLIEASRVLIQDAQEEHGKPRDSGDTLIMMSNLIFHTNAFYAQIDAFNKQEKPEKIDNKAESQIQGKQAPVKLRLINYPYSQTPENVIYYHALFYLGQEVFQPESSDLKVRKKKEDAVFERIQSLSERIKPEFGLSDRRERAMSALKDLSADNNHIITPKNTSSFGLPFLSVGGFFSVKVPTKLFNPSEGRFGQQFSLAENKIEKMSECEAVVVPEQVVEEQVGESTTVVTEM